MGANEKGKNPKTKRSSGNNKILMEIYAYPIVAITILVLLGAFIKQISILTGILEFLAIGYVGWAAVKKHKFGLIRATASGILIVTVVFLTYLGILALLGKNFLEIGGVSLTEKGIPPEFGYMLIAISATASAIFGGIITLAGAVIAQKIK